MEEIDSEEERIGKLVDIGLVVMIPLDRRDKGIADEDRLGKLVVVGLVVSKPDMVGDETDTDEGRLVDRPERDVEGKVPLIELMLGEEDTEEREIEGAEALRDENG